MAGNCINNIVSNTAKGLIIGAVVGGVAGVLFGRRTQGIYRLAVVAGTVGATCSATIAALRC